MRAQSFNTFICFAFLTLFFFIGLGGLFVAYNPLLLEEWVKFLAAANLKSELTKIGGVISLLSALLFFFFYRLNNKMYYQVELEPHLKLSTNPQLITQFIAQFFKEEDSSREIPFSLKVRSSQIEVLVDLTDVPIKAHEKMLKSWEHKMLPQLSARFGLPKKTKISVLAQKA